MRKGMTLEFKVTQQEITRLDSQKVYEKTKGYLYAHFVFSDDWEGYLKTVKFSNLLDNSYIGVTLASDNTCMVPYTLILYPGVTFCIEGTSHGDIITTNDFVFDVDESNSTVPEVPTDNYVEITSNDFTIKDDKIVFSNYIANEIMNMNKRIKADYSFVEDNISQGKFIAVLTPRAIIDYSSIQDGLRVYEYSTTNWLLDTYRTTYVEFFFDKNTEQLYLDSNHPAIKEDHIVGFDTSWDDRITLTSNSDMYTSTINPLRINDLSTTSIRNQPNLLFTANNNKELESVEFKQNGYSSDFKYTIPKGAKHYLHKLRITKNDLIGVTGNAIGTNLNLLYSIVTSSNEPITFDTFMNITHLDNFGLYYGTNVTGGITISGAVRAIISFSSYNTNNRGEIGFINDGAVLEYTNCKFESVDRILDTITEV